MNSPYDNNVGSNWGPPAGLSSMLAAQTQQGMEGMQNGAKMFDAAAAQFKQRQDEGKAADYLFKAHPEYLEQLGIHPEQFKTMGSVDKSRAATAVMQDNAMKDMMAKRADTQSQTNLRNAQAAMYGDKTALSNEEANAAPQMMQELAAQGRPTPAQLNPDYVQHMITDLTPSTVPPVLPGRGPAVNRNPELQAFLESGAKISAVAPRMGAEMLRDYKDMVKSGEVADRNRSKYGEPVKVTIGDTDFAHIPGSGVLTPLKPAVDLDSLPQFPGWQIQPDPQKGYKYVKAPSVDLSAGDRQKQLTALTKLHVDLMAKKAMMGFDGSGKPVAGIADTYDQALKEVESQLNELKPAGGGGGAAKPTESDDAAYQQEVAQAQAAIRSGVKRDKVAAQFKLRTGKDLPQ